MGNIFCSTCCTDGKPGPKFGEFLKPARFSGAVPTRYVVLNEGKIEYFERKGKGNDPLKGEDMKGFINLYEFVLQKNPLNPLMLTFGRSNNKHVKSNLPDIMPPSTRVGVITLKLTLLCNVLRLLFRFFLSSFPLIVSWFTPGFVRRWITMNSNADLRKREQSGQQQSRSMLNIANKPFIRCRTVLSGILIYLGSIKASGYGILSL